MKNINITLLSILLAFSGGATAGWFDFLSSSDETAEPVAETSETVNSIVNTVQGGQQVTKTTPNGLVDTLVNQLGVTAAQAQGGSGALFQVAKSKMTDAAFSQLSQSIPGMDGLLAAVPKSTSGGGGLLGGIAAASGNSSLASAASLVNTFQQLDLSKGMVSQFTPIVIDYVKKNTGELTGNLLQSALSGL